ncbi:MAG: response regulator transcription factor [Rhodospirillales bacterium]|nr:response regulator transcription factor [Rhodospirillales bacterium]
MTRLPGPLTVNLADELALFRVGMAHLLGGLAETVTVRELAAFAELLRQLDEGPVADLVVCDLALIPRANEARQALRQALPPGRLVIMAVSDRPEDVRLAVSVGAAGFVLKTSEVPVIMGAIRLVLAGGTYVPARHLWETGERKRDRAERPCIVSVHEDETADPAARLTARQRHVLDLLAQGMSNKDIAKQLGLTEGTVKVHVTSILRKLKATSRLQAVIAALGSGAEKDNRR